MNFLFKHTSKFGEDSDYLIPELTWYELKQNISKLCEYSKSCIILVYDIDREIFVTCSQSITDILGYKSSYFIDKNFKALFNLIDSREVRRVKQNILKYTSKRNSLAQGTYKLKYHLKTPCHMWCYISHELELLSFQKRSLALNYIYDFSPKEQLDKFFGKSHSIFHQIEQDDYDMTYREEQILKLIADGYSSKQIADKLFISDHTVISHRKNLISKFKAHNTAHLIRKASEVMSF